MTSYASLKTWVRQTQLQMDTSTPVVSIILIVRNVHDREFNTMIHLEESNTGVPKKFFDPHHHYYDPKNNSFQSFLGKWGKGSYLPEDYKRDVIDDIASIGVELVGSIHMEVIPDDGLSEVLWVLDLIRQGRCDDIRGIVASVNLADDDAEKQLQNIHEATVNSGLLKGVRWILDYVGKYNGLENATHAATTRVHPDGIDYLRGGDAEKFEKGFALLEYYNLSFDLQCAPEQFFAAADLISRHPRIPVCIDHMGKPRMVLGSPSLENNNVTPDETILKVWRTGLKALSSLPNVYIKLSMLGWAVPGWSIVPQREKVLRDLVRETVQLFGVERCMVTTNWHTNAAVSNADGLDSNGPCASEFLIKIASFFNDFSELDKTHLFSLTAQQFYRC